VKDISWSKIYGRGYQSLKKLNSPAVYVFSIMAAHFSALEV
jgi:hypothetical protein